MEDFFNRFKAITGIPKYSGSEVITPLNIVVDMVGMLPEHIFNPDATFLDPAVKSGRFLVEIYNKLFKSESVMARVTDDIERKHLIL